MSTITSATEILAHEVTAWQDDRNNHHAEADWQFSNRQRPRQS